MLIRDHYTGLYLKYDDELKKIITIEMGQKLLDWGKPGKDTETVARLKLCEESDFNGSQYLIN